LPNCTIYCYYYQPPTGQAAPATPNPTPQ
jgi:hypothetical protein